MRVRMTHPTLPGREITVAEQSVPHHERAGWQLAAEDAPDLAGVAGDTDAGDPPGVDSATPADAERDNEGDEDA